MIAAMVNWNPQKSWPTDQLVPMTIVCVSLDKTRVQVYSDGAHQKPVPLMIAAVQLPQATESQGYSLLSLIHI